MALGAGSVASADNTVSVGSASQQRKITFVQAGNLSASSTDAVSGSQLFATNNDVAALTTKVDNFKGGSKYLAANDAAGSTDGASATGIGSLALGGNAVADSTGGSDAAVAIGSDSRATVARSMAIGPAATASANNAIAIGTYSVADRANSVSVGTTSARRQIVNVAAGTQDNDVVNVAQLKSTGLKLDANGNATNALVAYDDTTLGTVTLGGGAAGTTITNLKAGALSATSTDAVNGSQLFATNQTVAQTQTQLQNVTSLLGGGAAINADGSVKAPAYNANGGTQNTVGAAITALDSGLQDRVKYDSSAHDMVTLGGGAAGTTITNLKAGALNATSTDAVNGSQLFATNQTVAQTQTQLQNATSLFGGGAAINADGSVSAPTYHANGGTQNTVGAAITALDSGLQDRVKYDSSAHDMVTLGNAGTPVMLTNVKAGALNATSSDAVNGSQLYTTNQNLTSTNADLTLTNMNLATLSGVAVKYDSTAHDIITLGNAGTPVALTNVKNAVISATSTDAVNGSQLYTTNASLAALSADAVKYDSAAHDIITFGNAGKPVKLTNVKAADLTANSSDAVNGAQLYATNQNVAKNTADISNLSSSFNSLTGDINNGQIGIVRQDLTTRVITIGGATDGTVINVAGTSGPRTVTGVKAGDVSSKSTDAINGSQLYNASASIAAALGGGAGVDSKSGGVTAPTYNVGGTQVHDVGSAIDNLDGRVTKNTTDIAALQGNLASVSEVASNAVAYDSKDHTKVTLGGATPADGTAPDAVQLTNVKDGELSDTSMDAVNGRQLAATNAKLDAYAGVVDHFQGAGMDYVAVNSSNQPLPVATGANAVAIGANATASGNNSVALGANSVADQDNTVSVGSAGSERRITNVAAGTSGTDAANVNELNSLRNDLGASMTSLQRSAFAGVAAAMAMPNLTPRENGKTVVAAGVGNYKGYSAFGAGATYRSRDGAWLVNGALSVTPHGDTGVRAQVGYEF